MSGLTLNQLQVQGRIYSLGDRSYQELQAIKNKGLNDGLDQVYFQAGEKAYFIEGDGLDIEYLKSGIPPQAQLTKDGNIESVKILFVDNETNTAKEGAKSIVSGAVGLLGLSLAGATSTSVYGSVLVSQGSTVIQKGSKVVSGSYATLGKSLDLAKNMLIDVDPKTNEMARELTNLFRKKAGKAPLPEPQLKTFVPIKGNVIETQIDKAVKGEVLMTKGAKSVSKGSHLVKTGLYIAGIGAAIAGVTLIGGAIYGANRPEQIEALAPFRKNPLY